MKTATRKEVQKICFADDLAIQQEEGVIDSMVTVHVNDKYGKRDGRVMYMSNCKDAWTFLKNCLDRGINVIVESHRWNGTTETEDWNTSPSYRYRFDKKNYDAKK